MRFVHCPEYVLIIAAAHHVALFQIPDRLLHQVLEMSKALVHVYLTTL